MKIDELKFQLKKLLASTVLKDYKRALQKSLNRENSFVVMPTGGGKSLCYQFPALVQRGTAIIVSPLIALMKNQVDALRGISTEKIAHVLNSSLNKTEIAQVKNDITSGVTKLLYVAPESLSAEPLILKSVTISFLAVDEAIAFLNGVTTLDLSTKNLKFIVEQFDPIPIIALTATATPKVQEDVMKNLGF